MSYQVLTVTGPAGAESIRIQCRKHGCKRVFLVWHDLEPTYCPGCNQAYRWQTDPVTVRQVTMGPQNTDPSTR